MKANPTTEQKQILKEFAESFGDRPSYKDYYKYQKRLRAAQKSKPPKQSEIPNTRPGYGKKEVQLLPEFTEQDIPLGFGLHPMYDSGSNHAIGDAGQMILTQIWNYWDNPIKNKLIEKYQ